MKNWVVVFNRAEAKIYRQNSTVKPLIHVKDMENSLGREKNKALTTDKPGVDRMKVHNVVQLHTMTRERNPHEEAATQFAREIAKELSLERKKGTFDKLVLVAEPHMAGLLKNALDKNTMNCVSESVLKNFAHASEHEITHMFQKASGE